MLRFILGKSGSGKTAYIYEQISDRVKSGESDIIMLIPDQSSFETEKFIKSMYFLARLRQARKLGLLNFSFSPIKIPLTVSGSQ